MYKFKSYLLSMLAVACMASLTSCKDDSEQPAPTMVISGPQAAGGAINAGAPINLIVTVTNNGGSNIDRFEVRYSANNSPDQVLPDETVTGINSPNYSDTFTFEASNNTTERYTFVAVNKDGKSVSQSVTFTIVGATEKTGTIFNLAGPNRGAWDLVADVDKGATDPDASKDMINTTETTGTNAAVFVKGWRAGNTTRFVPFTGNYATATQTQVKDAYMAGTPLQQVDNVAVGSMYVAKLRGQDTYALINVTQIQDDNLVGAGNNVDFIRFNYKKF